MEPIPIRTNPVRFGAFEVDIEAGELRKSGLKVPLQEQPFRVLTLLLENPGKVVTREELQQRLWPADTFVEFDRGLNTAINKVRDALGDSAIGPRFVETVPRRGYRFLAPVELIPRNGAGVQPTAPDIPRNSSEWPFTLKSFVWRNALSGVLLVVVAVLVWRGSGRPQKVPEAPLRKFTFTSEEAADSGLASYGRAAISPDGRRIAYVTGRGPGRKLWVWTLDRDEHRSYPEVRVGEGNLQKYEYPFWSPDSQFIGFQTASELSTIPVDTGPASILCVQHAMPGFSGGAAWSPDGNSIVLTFWDKMVRLYEVSSRGGVPRLLVQPLESERHKEFFTPAFVPASTASRLLLFSVDENKPEIVLQDLNSGRRTAIAMGAWPVYSPTGHILYQRSVYGSGGIWAVPFSLKRMKCTGEPFPVAENGSYPTVANDATLVYLEEFPRSKMLVWRNRAGVKTDEIGQPQKDMSLPSLSPDGRQVGVEGTEATTGQDVWIHDVESSAKTRVTLEPTIESRSIWSPDGREIAYDSIRNDIPEIFIASASAGGKSRPLLASGQPVQGWPDGWSPDGKYIVYTTASGGSCTVKRNEQGEWQAPPCPPGQMAADEYAGQFSPDVRFLAYCSKESGRPEIYVRAFPDGDRKWQVSRHGGTQPRWRKDGKEIFYVNGDTLIAVAVSTKPTFSVGATVRLFSSPALDWEWFNPTYDVSADGRRFVLIEPVGPPRKTAIRVVQNWFAEFRDRSRPPANQP